VATPVVSWVLVKYGRDDFSAAVVRKPTLYSVACVKIVEADGPLYVVSYPVVLLGNLTTCEGIFSDAQMAVCIAHVKAGLRLQEIERDAARAGYEVG
jgi:hypothetical protein